MKRGIRFALAGLVRARSGQRVLSGPFRGMLPPDSDAVGPNMRLLLGTHEMELHPAFEQLVATGPRTIINCGAARGYYAVGLALRCTHARVIAFEAVEALHPDIVLAAQVNGVADRVTVRGACDAGTLRQCVASAPPPVFVLADIEGNEGTIFASDTVAALAHATVLIETHDDRAPGTTDRLLSRFATTHRVEVCPPRDRTREDLPPTLASGPWRAMSWLLVWAMREVRDPHQQWLLFVPRSAA